MKKAFILLSILLMSLCLLSCKEKEEFSYWNKNESLDKLVAYVEDVTNKNSKNYIPKEDRIVVFDMDGTLCCEDDPIYLEACIYVHRILEDDSYEANEIEIDYANKIKETNSEIDGAYFTKMYADAFAGMKTEEYDKYIKNYINNVPSLNHEGFTYGDLWYEPMVEIVDYLNNNDFEVYICSGTDRSTCRAYIDGHLDVKFDNIMGSDIKFVIENDELVRSNEVITTNTGEEKIGTVFLDIGKKPILCFGNSTGDIALAEYTKSNDKYITDVFMVINDDEVRNNGNLDDSQSLKNQCDEYGWNYFSIKNDFKEIYVHE